MRLGIGRWPCIQMRILTLGMWPSRTKRFGSDRRPVGESYLNIEALIDAAKRSGADAVHPGYGFLSENAGFAQACVDAGFVFIGPTPAAIAAMGNKAAAKRLMIEAGVPCVPGYHGADQTDARFTTEAERIGFPVMVKAAAGGGGRGMRLVQSEADLQRALGAARMEAQSAFGSDELILEKAVVDARHVEIQVFADAHGGIIHLGERDCSVQRRHQKVLEEAPSPAVNPDLRARMGAAAVAAARAINYRGAGTVEFLLEPSGAFYFLEMNTRLQVEHPVTEMVTGLDLVAWQLRVAAGEPLPLTQAELCDWTVTLSRPAFMRKIRRVGFYRKLDACWRGRRRIALRFAPIMACLPGRTFRRSMIRCWRRLLRTEQRATKRGETHRGAWRIRVFSDRRPISAF